MNLLAPLIQPLLPDKRNKMCISRWKNSDPISDGRTQERVDRFRRNRKILDERQKADDAFFASLQTPNRNKTLTKSVTPADPKDPGKDSKGTPSALAAAPSAMASGKQQPQSPALSATQVSAPRATKEKAAKSRENKSDVELKNSGEEKSNKMSELKKCADRATESPHAPVIEPPRELRAKRVVEGLRESKDPEYATLDNDCPKFEKAVLRGNSREPGRLDRTQQQTSNNNDKRKKESAERTPK